MLQLSRNSNPLPMIRIATGLVLNNRPCWIFHCRIVIGAPNGTFPGGLPLTDPGRMAERQTGLVYSCPVLPGECEGIQGNTSTYMSNPDNDMSADALGPIDIEGRLFDQARKRHVHNQ